VDCLQATTCCVHQLKVRLFLHQWYDQKVNDLIQRARLLE